MVEIVDSVVPDLVSLDLCGGTSFLVGLGDDADILLVDTIPHEVVVVGLSLDTRTEASITIHYLSELIVGVIGIGLTAFGRDIEVGVVGKSV